MALACGALVIVACAAGRPFVPAEHVTAITTHGYLAAEYEMRDAQGQLGDVKLWSRGTFRENYRGEEETFAHVGFDIDNQTRGPLTLNTSQLYLHGATDDDSNIGPLKPAFIDGDATVAPGTEQTLQAWFSLPADVSPGDVRAFRIAWTVTGTDSSYSQRTPFLQARYRYYYSPYYDPFVYDPYGFHSRVSIHHYPYYYYYHHHRP